MVSFEWNIVFRCQNDTCTIGKSINRDSFLIRKWPYSKASLFLEIPLFRPYFFYFHSHKYRNPFAPVSPHFLFAIFLRGYFLCRIRNHTERIHTVIRPLIIQNNRALPSLFVLYPRVDNKWVIAHKTHGLG